MIKFFIGDFIHFSKPLHERINERYLEQCTLFHNRYVSFGNDRLFALLPKNYYRFV